MTLVTPYVIAIQAVFAQPLKIYLEHFYIKGTRRCPILAMTRLSSLDSSRQISCLLTQTFLYHLISPITFGSEIPRPRDWNWSSVGFLKLISLIKKMSQGHFRDEKCILKGTKTVDRGTHGGRSRQSDPVRNFGSTTNQNYYDLIRSIHFREIFEEFRGTI